MKENHLIDLIFSFLFFTESEHHIFYEKNELLIDFNEYKKGMEIDTIMVNDSGVHFYDDEGGFKLISGIIRVLPVKGSDIKVIL